jgi:hypothetical protein
MVGPFIFFDHMGPVRFASGQAVDVWPHPHIGLATVTDLFAGALMHRDSPGFVQRITPGDVNWMTAGLGLIHSERSPDDERNMSRTLHGIQIWIALPQADEGTEPGFSHYPAALPVLPLANAGLRLIAGSGWGLRTPLRTDSTMVYAALEADGATRLELPAEHAERALYVVEGEVSVGGQHIEAARTRWREQRFPRVPGETEFIPLSGEPH